jgi:hypothetical protein
MDIFTTQLTRVSPVLIKPTSFKVKALVKDAGSNKLKEDHDQFDHHVYYFKKCIDDIFHHDKPDKKQTKDSLKNSKKKQRQSDKVNTADEGNLLDEGNYAKAYADYDDNKDESDKDHKDHHLDLYA